MILEARDLHLDTRDFAPQPGDRVQRHTGAENAVLRAVAHWPLLGMWEVAVEGVRKPEITITVHYAGFGAWREVAGR